jgi:hypothetical protein
MEDRPGRALSAGLVVIKNGLAAKAKGLGGAEHLAPMNVGGARMAVLADAQVTEFSIIQPPQGS